MNETAVVTAGQPSTFAATVIPLMREYTVKMNEWDTTVRRDARGTDDRRRIEDLWNRFNPPAYELARQVSGMIEQGKLSSLEKLELRLRLAEFEAVLIELSNTLSDNIPF